MSKTFWIIAGTIVVLLNLASAIGRFIQGDTTVGLALINVAWLFAYYAYKQATEEDHA